MHSMAVGITNRYTAHHGPGTSGCFDQALDVRSSAVLCQQNTHTSTDDFMLVLARSAHGTQCPQSTSHGARERTTLENRIMIDISRILVGTDFSENSAQAFAFASKMARNFDARLFLLHFVDDVGAFAAEMDSEADSVGGSDVERAERAAQKRLMKMKRESEIAARITPATGVGSPGSGLCRYAEDADIDLIVMGTHGRTGLTRMMLGSVAEHVVRLAPCPVLTIPSESMKPEPSGSPAFAQSSHLITLL